jgi:uncharacterized protein YsxB (DUF464 family)
MIKIIVNKKDNQIVDITIKGHANSAEHGQDLVCAGVSASSMGVLNALEANDFLKNKLGTIKMKSGYIHILVTTYTEKIQVILETLVTILETMEETNTKFMKIYKVEV